MGGWPYAVSLLNLQLDIMKITLNGQEYELEEKKTMADLVDSLEIEKEAIAVALNMSVVPKEKLDETLIVEGDKVEIIRAVAGGRNVARGVNL